MAGDPTFTDMLQRLLRPERRAPSARTVEAFGWLLLFEGAAIVLAPQWVASLPSLPDFALTAAVYFRLVGLLVSGLGLLYTVSGRLDARGFVFALVARPAAGAGGHVRPVVEGPVPGDPGCAIRAAGLRQFLMDPVGLAKKGLGL